MANCTNVNYRDLTRRCNLRLCNEEEKRLDSTRGSRPSRVLVATRDLRNFTLSYNTQRRQRIITHREFLSRGHAKSNHRNDKLYISRGGGGGRERERERGGERKNERVKSSVGVSGFRTSVFVKETYDYLRPSIPRLRLTVFGTHRCVGLSSFGPDGIDDKHARSVGRSVDRWWLARKLLF